MQLLNMTKITEIGIILRTLKSCFLWTEHFHDNEGFCNPTIIDEVEIEVRQAALPQINLAVDKPICMYLKCEGLNFFSIIIINMPVLKGEVTFTQVYLTG